MRQLAPTLMGILLVCALEGAAVSEAWAQSSRIAPPPVRQVARGRLFGGGRQQRQEESEQPPAPVPTTLPRTPSSKPQPRPSQAQTAAIPAPTDPAQSAEPVAKPDPTLTLAKQAIDVSKRRFLDPTKGFSPWMIMHGVLALRQEYTLMIGNQPVNAIDYVTKQNPLYAWTLPDPLKPGTPMIPVRGHYFESTAYGGRAHPYIVSFAFEGHPNQFLAILSMTDLPLNHQLKVSDSQKPGAEKTITMADMVRHAQMNMSVVNSPGGLNEIAWTLWFLANYIEPDAKWTDKNGQPWSMEQLVRIQTNAPIFSGSQEIAPCGGTHGLFALACACNSYQQKFGKLEGAWLTARAKLDQQIVYAAKMQNRDGSFSSDFFKSYAHSTEMGVRFKSSGHMLEWLMMAMPPELLEQQWVKNAVTCVSNDLIRWQGAELLPADTGAMYHAVHALVLYRNRLEPPSSVPQPPRVVELPPDQKHPAPGTTNKQTDPKMPAGGQPEATIRLINPSINKLSPLGSARPLLRPITNSKDTGEKSASEGNPAAPPKSEKLGEVKKPAPGEPGSNPTADPTKPALEKPAIAPKTKPAPSEPKSEGAIVVPLTEEEGGTAPAPLFSPEPEAETPTPTEVKPAVPGEPTPLEPTPLEPTPATEPTPAAPDAEKKPAEAEPPVAEKKPAEKKPTPVEPTPAPATPPSLVPPLPEPTPPQSPSSSD